MENKEGKQKFIDAAVETRKHLFNILLAYDDLSGEDNQKTAECYPFNGSFDEWLCEYDNWVDSLKEQFFPENKAFNPTITVKELKAIISDLDDHTQIVVRDEKDEWWLNIKTLELPDEDNGMFTLTFHTNDDFETIQF